MALMLSHIFFSLGALVSCSASASQREVGNRTLQQSGSNAVMIVSGITGEDEYCLSVANGSLRFVFWSYAAHCWARVKSCARTEIRF